MAKSRLLAVLIAAFIALGLGAGVILLIERGHVGTSAAAFPSSMRIPIDWYARREGIKIVPADPRLQQPGSVVAQSTAEAAAISEVAAGTKPRVIGIVLATVTNVGGSANGLYWIVSMDQPNGIHPDVSLPETFFNVFIYAPTGIFAMAVAGSDPAYPPLPSAQSSLGLITNREMSA